MKRRIEGEKEFKKNRGDGTELIRPLRLLCVVVYVCIQKVKLPSSLAQIYAKKLKD